MVGPPTDVRPSAWGKAARVTGAVKGVWPVRRPVFRTLGAVAAIALVATIVGPIAPAAAAPTTRYIVKTSSAASTSSKVSKLRSAHVSVDRQYRKVFHGFSANLTASQVSQLESDPSVEAVVPDTKISASEPAVK